MMSAKQLKKLAELLGYKEAKINENNQWVYINGAIFDPEINPAQFLKCIEHFKMSLDWDTDKCHWVIFCEGRWTEGETLTEALMAALEGIMK